MSNVCCNSLVLRHANKSKLEEVWTACMRAYNLYPAIACDLLNYFRPEPHRFVRQLRNQKDGIGPRAHHWRLKKWRTGKVHWTSECILAERAVKVNFATENSPPLAACSAAINDHGFELEVQYDEEGFDYSGAFGTDFHLHFDHPYRQLPEKLRKLLDQLEVGLNEEDGKFLQKWRHP